MPPSKRRRSGISNPRGILRPATAFLSNRAKAGCWSSANNPQRDFCDNGTSLSRFGYNGHVAIVEVDPVPDIAQADPRSLFSREKAHPVIDDGQLDVVRFPEMDGYMAGLRMFDDIAQLDLYDPVKRKLDPLVGNFSLISRSIDAHAESGR